MYAKLFLTPRISQYANLIAILQQECAVCTVELQYEEQRPAEWRRGRGRLRAHMSSERFPVKDIVHPQNECSVMSIMFMLNLIFIILQVFISWNFYDYGLQIMKTQNSVSRKILILHKINKKKDILNRNVRLLKSRFISKESILGWASFCMNYCINAAWYGGNQPVALLRCNGRPGCFDSGQVICIVGSGVSRLPLDNTPWILYGVQVRRVCWPIKHSNTMVIEPAFGTFGSVGQVPSPAGKWN